MKLIDMTCPHCSAHLKVDSSKAQAICEHCGATILIDDEVQHIQYDNAEEAGYNFEKGRQRAQAEARREARNYNPQQKSEPPKKKRRTWLWVLGWICIFPLPLTILLLRKKEMKPALKYGIIAAAWILYFIIGLSGTAGNSNNDDRTNKSSSITSTENSTSNTTATTGNIKELSFLRKEDQKLKIGDSTSESYVNVEVKDRKAFSSGDVVFISENPEVATIEFTKEALTTYLYYKITGVSAGETYVYAASKDGSIQSEKLKVIVEGSGSNITAISFSDSSAVTIKVGQESNVGTLNVSLKNSWEYSKNDIVFISENPDVATITLERSSSGKTYYYKIHAISPGETTVYAQSNDGIISSDKISVIVPEPVAVESVGFDFEQMTIGLGETVNLEAVITPENADDKTVKWSCSDQSVATIDSEGKLVALAKGSATITAEANNGLSSSFELTVDASRRAMNLRVTHPRDDDNNIGDEWTYVTEINGERTGREYVVNVGDTLTFHAKFTESDNNPDVGEASKSYTVTEDDLINGFTVTMDLYVTENGGSNSGKSAHFVVTFTFTGK